MPTPLTPLIQALDAERTALLAELETLPVARLKAQVSPGRWSMLEIVEHLVAAERVILQGLPPVAELVARPRRLKHRLTYLVVTLVLTLRIPVKAPSRRMLPSGTRELADLRLEWDDHLRWLRDYATSLAPGQPLPAVFTHPVAGPITLLQALRMDLKHLRIHARQIRSLRAG